MAYETKMLGDVCRLINGRAYKKHEMLAGGRYPLLRVGNFFSNRSWYFSDLELDEDKYCDNGDLLYAWSASFGPRIWDGTKVIYHYHIWKIELNNELVEKSYLYHLLDWDTELIKAEQGTGSTMIHVTKGAMEKRLLPFPSISEQKRIVAILDQVFAEIEQVRAKTEQNLKNARELFESACMNSIFSSDAAPNHTVSDVAKDEKGSMRTGPFGSQLLKKEIVDEGIAVLGIDNAVSNNFQWGAKRFITQEKFEELSRFEVKPDDVLITIMGTCGRCAIVPKNIPKAINTKHICCITLEQSKCLPEYLHAYFLYHPIAKEYLLSRAKGAIMAGLNMGIIKELPLILPTLKEQNNLVSRVTKLKEHIDALEVTYRSKLNALEALKKSILQKAFAGELSKSNA
jgi:type I restriction enzyme S subunit